MTLLTGWESSPRISAMHGRMNQFQRPQVLFKNHSGKAG